MQYWPVDQDEDSFITEGRANDVEYDRPNTERKSAKLDAWCGSGSYSTVYRIRIDPDHHRLTKVRGCSIIDA